MLPNINNSFKNMNHVCACVSEHAIIYECTGSKSTRKITMLFSLECQNPFQGGS